MTHPPDRCSLTEFKRQTAQIEVRRAGTEGVPCNNRTTRRLRRHGSMAVTTRKRRATMETGDLPLVLRLRPTVELSEDQFFDLCQINRELRIERNAEGELLIMPPAGAGTSERNLGIAGQLWDWNRRNRAGAAFESSAGFTLPNGAVRSPDASWIARERWERLSDDQREVRSDLSGFRRRGPLSNRPPARLAGKHGRVHRQRCSPRMAHRPDSRACRDLPARSADRAPRAAGQSDWRSGPGRVRPGSSRDLVSGRRGAADRSRRGPS